MKKIFLMAILILGLTAVAAQAEVVTQTVDYEINGKPFEGYLAYDESDYSTRPGIVVYHAWMGPGEHEFESARKLAALGYVAFVADIYGKGVRASDNEEARKLATLYKSDRALFRKHANAAFKQLKKQKYVDANKLASIGYCFGGTAALELARSGADVLGTVTFHGGLDTPTPKDAKNIKGSVLALHGAADQAVPPEHVADFQKEMSDAKVDWYLEVYAYAPHAFTHKGPRYNEKADMRSWRSMKNFLKEIF